MNVAKIIASVVPDRAILRCECGRSVFVDYGLPKYACACGAVAVVAGAEPVGLKADDAAVIASTAAVFGKPASRSRRK